MEETRGELETTEAESASAAQVLGDDQLVDCWWTGFAMRGCI